MSSTSSEVSRPSSAINGEEKQRRKHKSHTRQAVKHVVQSASSRDILLFLVAYRILNALTIQTFFQPDEYFQSLEPAWRLAFGENSGAWITWVGAGACTVKSF
jgi:phosphatidylinositol glycan class B